MLTTLILLILAYIGASYIWCIFIRDHYPVAKDTWYDNILSYPMNFIARFIP